MTPEQSIRAFIALEISDDTRTRVGALIENLRKGVQFTGVIPKWVQPENMHLTLKFLGDIRADQAPPIAKVLEQAAATTAPFAYSVRGLGVFPSEWKPRVLWADVKRGAEAIYDLWEKVETGMSRLGYEIEDRPFTPHLTLARIKSSQGAKALTEILKAHNRVYCGESQVNRIILFKSELRPSGAVYTPLAQAVFQRPAIQEAEVDA